MPKLGGRGLCSPFLSNHDSRAAPSPGERLGVTPTDTRGREVRCDVGMEEEQPPAPSPRCSVLLCEHLAACAPNPAGTASCHSLPRVRHG